MKSKFTPSLLVLLAAAPFAVSQSPPEGLAGTGLPPAPTPVAPAAEATAPVAENNISGSSAAPAPAPALVPGLPGEPAPPAALPTPAAPPEPPVPGKRTEPATRSGGALPPPTPAPPGLTPPVPSLPPRPARPARSAGTRTELRSYYDSTPGTTTGAPPSIEVVPASGIPGGGTGGNFNGSYYELQAPSPTEPMVMMAGAAAAPQRGEQIIHDIKLKVLQHHYETTLSEAVEAEKAMLSAPPAEHEALAAKAKALHGFADKLEADIRALPEVSVAQNAAGYNKMRVYSGGGNNYTAPRGGAGGGVRFERAQSDPNIPGEARETAPGGAGSSSGGGGGVSRPGR